jgi:hypothetical protein
LFRSHFANCVPTLVALSQVGLLKEDLTSKAEHKSRVGQFVIQGHESNCNMLLPCNCIMSSIFLVTFHKTRAHSHRKNGTRKGMWMAISRDDLGSLWSAQ